MKQENKSENDSCYIVIKAISPCFVTDLLCVTKMGWLGLVRVGRQEGGKEGELCTTATTAFSFVHRYG